MKLFLSQVFLILSIVLNGQHSWTRTNPGGGGALNVAGATVDGDILVAADLSGIYKSTDGGLSFTTLGANQGLDETHINALGFDPNDGDTFFAGAYSYLYKTTDGGANFQVVFPTSAQPFDYSYIEDVAVAATNSNIAYVTHHDNVSAPTVIFKTTNGGSTWNNVSLDFPIDLHVVKLMIHPMNENVVYALSGKSRWGCGAAQLYRSHNGGVNWSLVDESPGEVFDFDLHPTDQQTLFISTFETNYIDNNQCMAFGYGEYVVDDYTAGETYKSTNGGTSFSQISDKTGILSVGIVNPNIIRIMDINYPFDWNGDAGTWESLDGGISWTHTGTVDNWSRGIAENQYFAYSGSFAGLNKTVRKNIFNSDEFFGTFGQWVWASFDGGIHMNNINSIEVSPNQWQSTGVENVTGHALDVNDSDPNYVYYGAYDFGFWRSDDNGTSWTRSQPNFNTYPEYSWNLGTPGEIEIGEAKRGAGSNVMNIVSDPTLPNVVWATFSRRQYSDPLEGEFAETGLFKSTNYGVDWTLITNGLPAYDQSIRVYGLTIDHSSPQGNRTLYITIDGEIYKSSNDGASWNVVLTGQNLKFVEVDRSNGSIVYAGGKDGLWRTIDAGTSWSEVGTTAMRNFNANTRSDIVPTWTDYSGANNVYPWEGVFDIESDPNVQGRVYVTVHSPVGGLYRSDDYGATWSANLFPDTHLRGIAVSPANSNVIYTTSSKAYHSGGFGNSQGVQYSTDAGSTWQDANDGMAYSFAGQIEVETGLNPKVWTWSSGTGMQKSPVPFFENTPEISVPIKAILQGPYDPLTLLMNDDLRLENYIPLQEPYTEMGYNPSGIGSTSNGILSLTGNDAVVDWVLIQARSGNNSGQVVASKSALIQRDGDVVNPDGTALTLAIPTEFSNVYMAIIHRNHFGVRTQNTYSTNGTVNIDFTNPTTPVFGDSPLINVQGKMAMISGDANDDGQINVVDHNNFWRIQNANPFSYTGPNADFNLDGYVNSVDRNIYWRENNSKIEQLD